MIIDQIEKKDVIAYLKGLPDETVDLAIIDPPYNLDKGDWDSFKTQKDFLNFTRNYLSLVYKKLKKTGSLYIFNTAYNSAYILNILDTELNMYFQNWIVWYKKDGFSSCKRKFTNNQETILFFTKTKNYTFNFNDVREPYSSTSRIEAAKKTGIIKNGKRWFPNSKGKLCPDVWEYASVRLTKKRNGRTTKQEHPTPKPEKMIERMILASSNKGDLVLDLFSGTGTTAFVAKSTHRHFIGCESNSNYIQIIKDRLK